MLGDFLPEPQGRVTLTPSAFSQKVARERGIKPKRVSKRALAAQLKAQRREEAVLAPQRPILDRVGFNSYLRTGSI